MVNTKQGLRIALLLLCLSLLPSHVAAQPKDDDSAATTQGNAESLRVKDRRIDDYEFKQTRPEPFKNIGLKRKLDIKLIPSPDRQNTIFENTDGLQVEVRPGKPKQPKP